MPLLSRRDDCLIAHHVSMLRIAAAVIGGVFLCADVTMSQELSARRTGETAPSSVVDAAASVSAEAAGAEDGEGADELDDLLDLADKDISQLSNVAVATPSMAPALDTPVSTAERKESTVGKTPAAVFVITNEMIRRSGARSIPEALRMAPGVQVARIDGGKWAVSIRGFNSRFANKLLVQVDGRTVYQPLFGGVFWDVQNVLLEDVERIEVIRGPGGTVWSDNAVNGVINVVTKSAEQTQGNFAEFGGGSNEGGFASVRHGRQLGPNKFARSYAKWFETTDFVSPTEHDDYRNLQVGSRMDWGDGCCNKYTLQGDYYQGSTGSANAFGVAPPVGGITVFDEATSGGNVLYRWNHEVSEDSDWQFQAYYDGTTRGFTPGQFYYERHTFDLDFQHRFKPRANHDLIWGGGFRSTWDKSEGQPFFTTLNPLDDEYQNINVFVQDTVTLQKDRLFWTIGTKFSDNDFTGFEVQPSTRLLFTPDERTSVWASLSGAVRTATRLSRDARITLPGRPISPTAAVFPILSGSTDVQAENVTSVELGARRQPVDYFSWDATLFYNDYTDLIGVGPAGPLSMGPEGLIVNQDFVTSGNASTWGFEVASNLQMSERWDLRAAYSFLHLEIEGTPLAQNGDSPRNQLYLQSSHQLNENVQADLIWRYVDSLFTQQVPSYNELDVRVGWQVSEATELYLVGQNLLNPSHRQFGNDAFAGTQSVRIPRGIYAGAAIRF